MTKSDDSSDLDSALKRPSARRAGLHGDDAPVTDRAHGAPDAHDADGQPAQRSSSPAGSASSTRKGKSAKRVHVRRPAVDADSEPERGSRPPSVSRPSSRTTVAPASEAPRVRASLSSSVPPAASAAHTAESLGPLQQPLPATYAGESELIESAEPADQAVQVEGYAPAVLARTGADRLTVTAIESSERAGEMADDFGLDSQYEAMLRPWLERLCRDHLHVEVQGIHGLPAHGRALLVANHSRSPLWDGIILRTALRMYHESRRAPRWLVDDQQFHAPFLGTFVNRLGAVRACQDNAERLLWREELVAVFPEGAKAVDRSYEDRYRLQRFGRGGYVKLALRTGTPVIPVAIVACERSAQPGWGGRLRSASRWIGAPLRALGPSGSAFGLGVLAMPPWVGRVRISIGEPVREIARQDALATRDDGLVHELNERVRGAVQQLVNAALHT